jgi:uncharacterized protein
MIEEIIALKRKGLSFRKIAQELNTTVGKVQYQWVKLINNKKADKVSKGIAHTQHSGLEPLNNFLIMSLLTPERVFLQWSVCTGTIKLVKQYFQLEHINLAIRLNDVTHILYDGGNAHSTADIGICPDQSHWTFSGLKPNHCYVAEIGVFLSEANFFPLVRSNAVHAPRNSAEQAGHLGHELQQFLLNSTSLPNWVEHVSTYSYYEKEQRRAD